MSPVEPNVKLEELKEGDLCEFAYYQQGENYQWYEWHTVAVFLDISRNRRDVLVSYRPLAGTSSIPVEDIKQIHRHRRAIDRLGDRGDSHVRLPKKLKGAVQR